MIMRRMLIGAAAVSICVLPNAVFARGLAVGPKLGLDLANLTGSDVQNNSIKIGAEIGGYLTYSFSDLIALQPELIYTMKGANFDVGGRTFSDNFNYLEIPILARLSFLKGKTHPIVFLGPEVAMLLSADANGTDIKDRLNSTDFGIVLGAGVGLGLGRGTLTIDARYDLGLTSIGKEQAGKTPDVKNSVISLTVGYLFSL